MFEIDIPILGVVHLSTLREVRRDVSMSKISGVQEERDRGENNKPKTQTYAEKSDASTI